MAQIILRGGSHGSLLVFIMKTRLYNCDSLKPHFYKVKIGFTRVYIICFLILLRKHRLWVLIKNRLAEAVLTSTHICHKLWTKFCEKQQNFNGDLTKFCAIFLNITLGLPQYSLQSFFSRIQKLVKARRFMFISL